MFIGVSVRIFVAKGQKRNSDQLNLKRMLLSGTAGKGPGEAQGRGGGASGTESHPCAEALGQPTPDVAKLKRSFPRPASPVKP